MENEKIRVFWNKRAKKYPRAFDKSVYKRTLYVLERIQQAGVSFDNKRVLEIGIGTGVYGLPIAMKAKYVVGLDCSEQMLNILKEESKKHHISNIEIYTAFWHEVDIDKMVWRAAFDIVLAAMTPAIKTREDVLKMEACSKKWLVYVGWGRKRENILKQEIFRLHGTELKIPGGVLMLRNILEELGRKPYCEFYETSWDWQGSIEEALDDVSSFLEAQGINPDKEKILKVLEKYAQNGKIKHTTHAEQGFLVWSI